MKFEITNSRGLYCPEGASNRLTPASYETQRQQCTDICGGEDRISVFELSPDPTWAGREDVYCCGCVGGCPSGQTAVPTSETTLNEAARWCEARCEGTHEHFGLNGGIYPEAGSATSTITPACCECTVPRVDEFREAGSQIACLRVNRPATPDQCTSHSGTNGTCRRVVGGLFGSDHCEWEPDTCDADSDCNGPEGRAGAGHCWGGQCFQTWLLNGDICEDLGGDADGACESRHCESHAGIYDYCAEEPCNRCISGSRRCEENSECSMGSCVDSGQTKICR